MPKTAAAFITMCAVMGLAVADCAAEESEEVKLARMLQTISKSFGLHQSEDKTLRTKLVARLFACGTLDGMLSKIDISNSVRLEMASDMFFKASVTFSDGMIPSEFRRLAVNATEHIFKLNANENKREMFLLLRNCAGLSEQPQQVDDAILQLTLEPPPE